MATFDKNSSDYKQPKISRNAMNRYFDKVFAGYEQPKTSRNAMNRYFDKVFGEYEPPEQESETSGGLLDAVANLAKLTGLAATNFVTSSAPHLLGGTVAEIVGNAASGLGETFGEGTWRRRGLESVGELAQNVADSALQSGTNQVTAGNNDEYRGAFANAFESGAYGVLGGLASMLHADKSANAFNRAVQKLADETPVEPELSWEYFTSPHGLTRSFGQTAGSMAAILPSMLVAPETLGLRAATALGGDAITQALINRGLYGVAKQFAQGAPQALQYGLTSPWVEGAAEGGHVRREALEQGVSDEEATRRSINTMAANIPTLAVSNSLEGLLLGAPLLRNGSSAFQKVLQGIARWQLNAAQQGLEEGTQAAISNAQLGKPYSLNPFRYAPDQLQEALEGYFGSLPLGIAPAVNHVVGRRDTNAQNFDRGSDETISNADYAARANQAGINQHIKNRYELSGHHATYRNWAKNISGGQMSDEVFNSIVRNAQNYGVPVDLALALATAESNGVQGDTSEAGAIGVMQLMPETAQALGVDPYDTEQNIRGGIKYLKQQLDAFNGDWKLAAAAYNAGPGAVQEAGGIPNYSETQNYVARIGGFLEQFQSNGNRSDETRAQPQSGERGAGEGSENLFGVENYDMPTQGDNITAQVSQLKSGWQKVIPQIGGVLKNKFGINATISSAARSAEHNAEVGGVPTSYHIIREDGGDALDIVFDRQTTQAEQDNIADYFRSTGLFSEVLYHDVGSGAHLHLGGLRTENLSRKSSAAPPRQSTPQPQQQQPPQVDIDDDTTKNLFARFAEERRHASSGEQAAEDELFFEPMFKGDTFQNTAENRAAILDNFGDEFRAWVNAQQEQPAQPTPPKPKTDQASPYLNNEPVIAAAKKFLEQLSGKSDPKSLDTLINLQSAIASGDVATVENILRQNQQQQQPTQEPVQNNTPPENILPQPTTPTTSQPTQHENFVAGTTSISYSAGEKPTSYFTAKPSGRLPISLGELVRQHGGFSDKISGETTYLFETAQQRDNFIKAANTAIKAAPPKTQEPAKPRYSSPLDNATQKFWNFPNAELETPEAEKIYSLFNEWSARKDMWKLQNFTDEIKRLMTQNESAPLSQLIEQARAKVDEVKPTNQVAQKTSADAKSKVLEIIPADKFISEEEILDRLDDIEPNELPEIMLTLQTQGLVEEKVGSYKRTATAPQPTTPEPAPVPKIDDTQPVAQPIIPATSQPTQTTSPESPKTAIFRRNDETLPDIPAGRKAIQEAPAGTKVRVKWAGLGSQSTLNFILDEKTFRQVDENGQNISRAYARNSENLRKFFGSSGVLEIALNPQEENQNAQSQEMTPEENQTDEQRAINEFKQKAQAELYEIFNIGNGTDPRLEEIISKGIIGHQYDTLQDAQKDLEKILAITREAKAADELGKLKADLIFSDYQNKRIEADLKRSHQERETRQAKRAKIVRDKEILGAKLKEQLSQILDLDNHPALKQSWFETIDSRAREAWPYSVREFKRFCREWLEAAKKIRDAGEIETAEAKAKERLAEENSAQDAQQSQATDDDRSAFDLLPNVDELNDVEIDDTQPTQAEVDKIISDATEEAHKILELDKYPEATDWFDSQVEGGRRKRNITSVEAAKDYAKTIVNVSKSFRGDKYYPQGILGAMLQRWIVSKTNDDDTALPEKYQATKDEGEYLVKQAVEGQLTLDDAYAKMKSLLAEEPQNTRTQENFNQDAKSQETSQKPRNKKSATLHAKLKTDTHPKLKTWLAAKLVEAATPEGKQARAYLESLAKKNLTDEQLDNAEAHLQQSKDATPETLNFDPIREQSAPKSQAEIAQILNDAKEEAYKILEADKYPEIKDWVDKEFRSMRRRVAVNDVANAEIFAKKFVQIMKRNEAKSAEIAANEMFEQWQNRYRNEMSIYNLDTPSYRKANATFDAANKIISQMIHGALTPEKAYAELKRCLADDAAPKSKGKWRTVMSSPSREELQKFMRKEFGNDTLTIRDDGTVFDEAHGRNSNYVVRTKNGRWQLGKYEDDSEPAPKTKPEPKAKPQAKSDANESISAMNSALREVSEKIINEAAKNPDTARALEQLGATVKNGKVSFPDDKTFQACVNLVNAIQNGKILAWHGTKADFDVFSNEAAFSGYGEMAHGWGLYFSASPNIAEIYRRAALGLGEFSSITNNVFNVRGKNVTAKEVDDSLIEEIPSDKKIKLSFLERLAIAFLDSFHATTVEEATERAKFEIQRQMNMFPNDTESERKALELIEKGEVKIIKCSPPTQLPKGEGRIYTVAIPNESEMLDEQQDFSEQSPKVHRALEEISKIIGLKFNGMNGKQIYDVIATEHLKKGKNKSAGVAIHETSTLLNKNGIKGITYDAPGERDGRCYVVFDDKAIEILKKFSSRGNVDTTIKNFVAPKDLNSLQRAYAAFAKELGVPIVFFRGAKNLHGVHANGISYYNVNAKFSHEFVYWHEFGHWLKNNQSALFNQLLDAAGITDEQVAEKRKSRPDLSDDELREEIICDAMSDIVRRTGLLNQIGKKNSSLIQRLISWARTTLGRFTDWFHTRERGLTTAQRAKMYEAFGKVVRQIEDADGRKIFRYNSRTHEVELADGRKLPTVDTSSKPKYSTEAETKKDAFDGAFTSDGRLKNPWKARQIIKKKLDSLRGIPIVNKSTGISAQFGKEGISKLVSDKALKKTVANGFSEQQHFEAAMNIKELFENAELNEERPDRENDVNIKTIKYFHCETNVVNEYAVARIMVKDTVQHGHHIYTIELQELNKPTELENYTADNSPVGSEDSTLTTRQGSTTDAEEPSAETISQEERGGKVKYSLDASDERGFFDRTWDKFAKALHLKGDKIVTEEDQRKAHRAAQERAMEAYIKEPSKENRQKLADLHVTKGQLEAYRNGEEYENELSLRQYTVASPSRIADKVMVFRAFYRMGERAMDKLVQLRGKYERKYNGVMELVGNEQEREKLFELLWNGDLNHEEFGRLTDEEVAQIKAANPDETTAAIQRAKVEKICKEQNVSAKVAQAYLQTRRLITAAYHMINEARRHPRTLTKHLSDSAIDELKANKFVEVKHISDERDSSGRRRVTYKEYQHVQRSFVATPADLARFETDDAIQILDEQSLDDGNFLVRVREGKSDLNRLTGYIPHFFHTYVAVVKDAHGKQVGDILFTGKTERDAIKLAEQWQKTHTLKDGEQIYISPRGLDDELGMDAEKLAPIMGDKDLVKMLTRLAEKYDVTLDQARQIMSGTVRQKNRHRFLGNLLERKGAKGFVEDMDWILRHYFRIATRYSALESEFKPHAISLFERVFGAFDNDYSKNPLANYTKQYIEDVNGNPTTTELILNRMLNKTKAFRLFITPAYGNRGVLTLTNGLTRATAYLKLGFLNVSSAMLNLTQLINAAGKLGGWQVLSKHVGKLLSRGGKLTQSELRILAESGVLNDIGLDTSTGYDRNRASLFGGAGILGKLDNLGNKSMWLFQKLDSLCRASSALAAYEKAVAEGKSRAQALDYAKKVNLDANFSYGVEDAPNMFRRSGPIGKVLFQFMKYPVKELEIVAEMLPTSKRTTFAQKAAFWFPYLLACGLSGFFPFFDWGDEFLNKNFKLFPKDFMQKVIIKGSQEVFGADSELGRKVAQSLMYGIGAVANVDVSKRAGMASIMPRDLQSFLLGAAGSTLWGTTSNLAQGNYENALRSFSPGLFNIYAAAQGETHTSRDRKSAGYDAWGRAVRLMGFKSVDESFAADAYRIYHNEQDEHTKAEQRAIDAYIADPSPENRKRLQELKIKPERVKTERRKKNLDRMERLQQIVPKKRRKDYEYLFKFAQ